MACSTELPRPQRSIVGAFRQARISCSPGKPRNSSPTGNDCRKARPTVSNFSKTAFPCLETKLARSFFSFHRNFRADADRLGKFFKDAVEQPPILLRVLRSELV